MAYSADIAAILTNQLTRFACLNRHQLVGQVANLDFWLAEVRHCLEVIDGYQLRFDRLKTAQEREVTRESPGRWNRSDVQPTRVSDSEMKEARKSLRDAVYRFLTRCYKESVIDEAAWRKTCQELDLGIDPADR